MGLLNFVDTGFIIILAILLLISGGIMFYCYRRLNLLEESIINQGKILQNLIINLQNNNLNSNNNYVNDSVNNNVNEYVNNNDNLQCKNVNLDKHESMDNKIQVSDDDESYSESEDELEDNDDENKNENIKSIILNNNNDNDSEISNTNESMSIKDELSDDDVFEDENNVELNNNLLEQSLMSISMKIVNNTNTNNENDIKILQLSDDIVNNITDKTFISNISENKDLNLEEDNKDLLEIEEMSTTKNDDFISNDKKSEQKIKGINKMKLDDLKQLVIDRNINLEEDVNNMKKADLIKILSN